MHEIHLRAQSPSPQGAQHPLHHRDPFDRLLIAQVFLMPAQLHTADSALLPYPERVRLI
ncbi:MAG: hypothetical protein IV089_12825 [Thiobacillus sp.]|nr:hypothetical protein [Thiobacillus sp.]